VAPDVCLDQIRVRELFGAAAHHAATLGRLDPYVYSAGPDGVLSLSVTEQPSTTPTLELFRSALAKIDGDPKVRDAFNANLAAARQLCPEADCPRDPVAVVVKPNTTVGKQREVYDLTFPNGAPPKTVLSAFAAAYGYDNPEAKDCTTLPAVDIQKLRIYVSSGLCVSDWPPPNIGNRCRPPTGGHWTVDGEDLCCL